MYGAHTDQALRGDYRKAQADFTVDQRDHDYSDADHALWRRLYARQAQLLQTYACREFRDGLARTDAADGVPKRPGPRPIRNSAAAFTAISPTTRPPTSQG